MNKVLIIVDMLNDFIKEDGALYCGKDATEIILPIKEKLTLARENNDLVIFLCDSHKPDDKEFNRFPKHAVVNTHGAQIIDILKPNENGYEYVIKKTRYSGLYNTSLNVVLKLHAITHAEVVGVCTSICVLFTVADLVNRDIITTIDTATVAGFDKAADNAALKLMAEVLGCTMLNYVV